MRPTPSKVGEKGSAFVIVTLFAVTATLFVGAFFSASLGKVRHVAGYVAEASAFHVAEAGVNAAIEKIWSEFLAAPETQRMAFLDKLDGKHDPNEMFEFDGRRVGASTFTVFVQAVRVEGADHADVEIIGRGANGRASKTVRAVIRFAQEPAEVFDYGYFINNFGWLYGSSITVNGSVRSNANFECRDATVNGHVQASENEELGATGEIFGSLSSDTIDDYNAEVSGSARPTNPSAPPEDLNGNGVLDPGEDRNGNGELDDFEFPDGYDGAPEFREHRPAVDMPYLGDLSSYRALAHDKGGTITQGGVVLVDEVQEDQGAEPRNIVLVGTAAAPLVINGPVVIENDVIIKGVVSGQGTIYAGRNVHIVGDITYANPPSWPHHMEDAEAVRQANSTADLIGFAAKGSIVMGDYTNSTWRYSTSYYQRPPFTQPYIVDPSDASIGYVSYHDGDGNPVFNGDYTALDGGTKDDGVTRRFYESSLADTDFQSTCESTVTHVDGVLYTNHLLSGRIGEMVFNGAVVSRDEALIYSRSFTINYDIRTRQGSYEFLDVFLPRQPSRRVLLWSAAEKQPETNQ